MTNRIPSVRFAHLPTPLEPLPRLSAALGGPKLLVKRDDQTGLALGGNKTRKLEFVIAEALGQGAKTLITLGAAQSNHCRQTAALAARLGLDCIVVLSGEPPDMVNGNLLLDGLLGAEIIWAGGEDRQVVFQQAFDTAWQAGRRPYAIPLGASNALGALGYEQAFRELLDQTQEPIDAMVVASSSGGTQAGLLLGARRAGWQGQLIGISIDHPARLLQEGVAFLAGEAADRLGESIDFSADAVLVRDEYLGGGYGVLGDAEREAIGLFARLEGLLLDPVYTGRAAAGLIDLIRRGHLSAGQTVVFWHTGGVPALFAEQYARLLNQSL